MALDEILQPHSLTNKPLVEAIFELRWALQQPGNGLPPRDPGFRISLGRYYDRVRKDYPVVVDLPTAQVPEDMTAYTVRHQFRAGENQWPLTQLGPGIMTVNDTKGYTWESFRPRVLFATDAVFGAYPSDIQPFMPYGLRLRYIDAIAFDPAQTDPVQFLKRFLHIDVQVEPRLFENPPSPDPAQQIKLHLTFPLKQPRGSGILGFASGTHDGKPSIILETIIRSDGDDVPKEKKGIATWVDEAHDIVDKWFFTLIRGELLRRFEAEHASAGAY